MKIRDAQHAGEVLAAMTPANVNLLITMIQADPIGRGLTRKHIRDNLNRYIQAAF